MKEFTLPMAVMDYLPVILFFLAVRIISGDIKERAEQTAWILFETGAAMVAAAGFLKATYKLLIALGIGEFSWMSQQFFSNQAFGFLICGIGLTMAVMKQPSRPAYAIMPVMALVAVMVIGLGAMDASLCYLASKEGKKKAMVFFIISFFLSLCMGYLSSRDFSAVSMNWIAQCINLAGQLLFFLGCRDLHDALSSD